MTWRADPIMTSALFKRIGEDLELTDQQAADLFRCGLRTFRGWKSVGTQRTSLPPFSAVMLASIILLERTLAKHGLTNRDLTFGKPITKVIDGIARDYGITT